MEILQICEQSENLVYFHGVQHKPGTDGVGFFRVAVSSLNFKGDEHFILTRSQVAVRGSLARLAPKSACFDVPHSFLQGSQFR
jgi:hypothetical protein